MKSTLRWCGGSVPPVRREMASWLWHLCIRLCFHACAKGMCVCADLLVILRVHLRLCTPFACRWYPDRFTRKGRGFASVSLATSWAANQPGWGPSRLLSQCRQVKDWPGFLFCGCKVLNRNGLHERWRDILSLELALSFKSLVSTLHSVRSRWNFDSEFEILAKQMCLRVVMRIWTSGIKAPLHKSLYFHFIRSTYRGTCLHVVCTQKCHCASDETFSKDPSLSLASVPRFHKHSITSQWTWCTILPRQPWGADMWREKSHFSLAAAAESVQTLEGPVQASCILFWAKVQLSLGLGPVKSFA